MGQNDLMEDVIDFNKHYPLFIQFLACALNEKPTNKEAKIKCQSCGSERILYAQGKCSDLCFIRIGEGKNHDGYVPNHLNIGGDDEMMIDLCLDCGQTQGKFPVPKHKLEE